MADPADKAHASLARRLRKVYGDASKDIDHTLSDFAAKFKKKDSAMRDKIAKGEITQGDYDAWLRGQVFTKEIWKAKKELVAATMFDADLLAQRLINGERLNVFAENYNTIAYDLETQAGIDLGFTIYDQSTVAHLLVENPNLLPKRNPAKGKSTTWYKNRVNSAITKGIITGKSIQDIAKEIARETADTGYKASLRNARTAMTGAQNAGRIEAMHQAQSMGIDVKKKWLATLDGRTRDAHGKLDGQVVEVDKPFKSDLGPIMYPGDPTANPANVYNCRCTLTYVHPKYDYGPGKRYNQETGEVISGMTYTEWKNAKENGTFDEANISKYTISDLMSEIKLSGADHVFKGIWKDDITFADWNEKKGSIDAKRKYLESKLNRAISLNDTDVADDVRALLKELDDFELNGQHNYDLLELLKTEQAHFKELVKNANEPDTPFGAEAYTQARKDAALWAKSGKQADNVLRARTGEVWRAASPEEREAIYEYTRSYHKYNEPLRGIEYGSSVFKGVGKTDLDASYAHNGERLNAMTDIINKCTYDEDVWLQRGCGYGGMDKFLQIDMNTLQHGSQDDLERDLLDKTITEYGFMSCGSAKGQGFSTNPIMFNVYAPTGTKMMYVEPFSAFGDGSGFGWDGIDGQSTFGSELETIIQQGTQFRITKVEKSHGTIYLDIEVIAQNDLQYWTKP